MKSKWIALLLLVPLCAPAQTTYQSAQPGYRYEFPRDHFNHEGYQTEWWYYTGNLSSSDGHRFGFELTFFRQGVSREPSTNPWFVSDLWMAHLALSDLTGQKFYHEERLNRSGPGLAGVDEPSAQIWNGNWQGLIRPGEHDLSAVASSFQINLKLIPAKPPVIHGQNGISQKAEGAGHASHYISLTRLQTSGIITLNGKPYTVDGASWMDHEFFTGSMADTESGWDWLSIQLEDNSELMLYRLRHRDGTLDPYFSGTFIDPQGRATFLPLRDFTMTPAGDNWTSPRTKATYPERWHISIPKLSLDLDVTTPLREQELVATYGPSYWEGSVNISAKRAGAALHGLGYLEMTGYASPGQSVLPR
ncbi:carotenoid 1,2-hydratase [Acidobacteria bacterium AB60]|nr:carotenoid 1,2-hydratase [Acidobacteria bacterium AB60]